MKELCIGIDPGESGAISFLSDGKLVVYDFSDPIGLIYLKGVSTDTWEYDSVMVLIEKVNSMPKQGVASSFKFGKNFGQWIGRLEALDIPYEFTSPHRWQKTMFEDTPRLTKTLKGKKVVDTKAMSLAVARRLFPGCGYFDRKKDNGRSDAALIAEFLRRLNRGEA